MTECNGNCGRRRKLACGLVNSSWGFFYKLLHFERIKSSYISSLSGLR